MTAAERERITALEASLEHHIQWSMDFDKRISGDLRELKTAVAGQTEWQNRRSGVEALGKYVIPALALILSMSVFVFSILDLSAR